MFSSTVLSVLVVLAFVAPPPAANAFPPIQFDTFNTSTVVEIVTFDDYDEVVGKSELIPLSRSRAVPSRYTFGSRLPTGDYLVSQGSGMKYSSEPKSLQMRLNYPSRGEGATITYVEINVEQSSGDGRAYIVSGGIKERSIRIMMVANATNKFNYSYKIYGTY